MNDISKFIKKVEFASGLSAKTGYPYYRVDVYFSTIKGTEYKKSFFLKPLEVSYFGLDSFSKKEA